LVTTLGIGYFQEVLLNTIGQRVMYDLRAEIFHEAANHRAGLSTITTLSGADYAADD
jgi:hypothetical protein